MPKQDRRFSLFGAYDATLLVVVLVLLIIGLLAVYSATVWLAASNGNPAYWFRKQLLWAALGVPVMLTVSRIPYTLWRRLAVPMLVGTLLMLFVVLLMPAIFGSRRFLLGRSVQPSEVAKFALVVYASTWLASRRDRLNDVGYGLIPFSAILGLVGGMVALQPDIGTAFLLVSVGMVLFFIAGAELRQLLVTVAVGGVTFAALIAASAHAQQRIEELLVVWNNPDAERWSQLTQALRVMRMGGVWGQGPGALDMYVPAIHHDFILAAVGHAFGLVGVSTVLVLFGILAYRGYVIAGHAPDPFAQLMAAGMTTWLILQALVNMGVAVAVLPPTGITLPFVSYGGSSLLVSLAAAGVLLNISQYVPMRMRGDASTHVRRGHGRTRVPRAERA